MATEFKNTETEIDLQSKRLIEVFQRVLKSKGINASGDLSRSFKVIESGTRGIRLSFDGYGEIVDAGRRPSSKMPPVKPIQDWLRDKNIRPKGGATIEQLSFAIAKTIQRRGYRPQPFIQMTLNDFAETLALEIEQPLADDIENNIQKDLNRIDGKTFEIEL